MFSHAGHLKTRPYIAWIVAHTQMVIHKVFHVVIFLDRLDTRQLSVRKVVPTLTSKKRHATAVGAEDSPDTNK
jgi:hypothetical protein